MANKNRRKYTAVPGEQNLNAALINLDPAGMLAGVGNNDLKEAHEDEETDPRLR